MRDIRSAHREARQANLARHRQRSGHGQLSDLSGTNPGPFGTQLNPDHAFLNLAMVLLYVPDRRAEDTRVAFDDVPESWHVAVELDAAGTAAGQPYRRVRRLEL